MNSCNLQVLWNAMTPEYPQMKEITNLALNAPTLDCYHAPATSDKDLGEFCIGE